MKLKLCLLIAADSEPCGRFIDVGKVPLHEHVHERHEVRVVKGCRSLCNKPRNSSEVQDCELQVLRRQLPTVGGPGSHPIGGGIIGSEVRTSSRFLEAVLLSQEKSKELLGVGEELLNGLVLIGGELCGNKELFSWSLQEDVHGGTCNTIVSLEVLPPILLELTRRIEKAQTWPYFVELSLHQGLSLPPLQPFLCAIAALQHFGWLLYCDLRVGEGALRP